jgi:hypothetical protein
MISILLRYQKPTIETTLHLPAIKALRESKFFRQLSSSLPLFLLLLTSKASPQAELEPGFPVCSCEAYLEVISKLPVVHSRWKHHTDPDVSVEELEPEASENDCRRT